MVCRWKIAVCRCIRWYFGPPTRTTCASRDDPAGAGAGSNGHTLSNATAPRLPFNEQHRIIENVRPKPWFVLSVLGYFLQREMNPLINNLLSFVGRDARLSSKKTRNKRIRSTDGGRTERVTAFLSSSSRVAIEAEGVTAGVEGRLRRRGGSMGQEGRGDHRERNGFVESCQACEMCIRC